MSGEVFTMLMIYNVMINVLVGSECVNVSIHVGSCVDAQKFYFVKILVDFIVFHAKMNVTP